jgi:hypothetical protein
MRARNSAVTLLSAGLCRPWTLDLLIEYRQLKNGVLDKHAKRDLLSVLGCCRLPTVNTVEKKKWQDRILAGEPFSEEERRGILDYCWSDVVIMWWQGSRTPSAHAAAPLFIRGSSRDRVFAGSQDRHRD